MTTEAKRECFIFNEEREKTPAPFAQRLVSVLSNHCMPLTPGFPLRACLCLHLILLQSAGVAALGCNLPGSVENVGKSSFFWV